MVSNKETNFAIGAKKVRHELVAHDLHWIRIPFAVYPPGLVQLPREYEGPVLFAISRLLASSLIPIPSLDPEIILSISNAFFTDGAK